MEIPYNPIILTHNCHLFSVWTVIASSVGCSHSRAIHFFIESINTPCKFTAFHCKSYLSFYTGACDKSCKNGCNRMGYHASKTATGTFFLKTNAAAPYCNSWWLCVHMYRFMYLLHCLIKHKFFFMFDWFIIDLGYRVYNQQSWFLMDKRLNIAI